MLRGSERDAMRRMTATAAFVVLARTDAGREAALAELSKLAGGSPSQVQLYAEIGKGLIEASADGLAFLQIMAP